MKAIKCKLVLNTRWGYCMPPIECKSINEAIRIAREEEMAYRIFVDGKCIKNGWF